MSFHNANTFSFAHPEVPRSLNGGTVWLASPDNRTLAGNSPRSAGFLEQSPPPTSEPLLDWDAFSTLMRAFEDRVVYGDYVNDLDETSQLPPLESRDTAESSLNERVDDSEQELQLAIVPIETATSACIPQRLYQPRGETEREKYVQAANLSLPILFCAEKSHELGVALEEILKNSRCLSDRDDPVFEGGGQFISVRLEWPGYPPWSYQLPTRDCRKIRGPITKAKLAKKLATCIRKFIEKMAIHRMEADSDPMWRISPRHIKFEDLILISLIHVSQGSWQPKLQLRRQMRGASSRA
ncbi:uncharacterized protein F5891DRAFT_974371 [Suillus fuscotomentosus]|uniref:Uncharacterized protein n=1 Tax=Suillus fuscotomentosus TaxID=1912939 RepID=A0AAD4HUM6_9AGAM|nr:uncharacterized protein F5891DRAFT_974371 [Suillus fuscotomentosus]KAG1907709.1 hypothetical protein F5891DRAFT_974371 [Suillus fuscotomentosus]